MNFAFNSANNISSNNYTVNANFSAWKTLEGGMRYFHLLNYYPSWMDRKNGFRPTQEEWDVKMEN